MAMRVFGLTITRTAGSRPADRVDYHRDEPTNGDALPADVGGYALGAGPGRRVATRQGTCAKCGIRCVTDTTDNWEHVSAWSETHQPDVVDVRSLWTALVNRPSTPSPFDWKAAP